MLALLLGCTTPEPAEVMPTMYAGCPEVDVGPRCLLAEETAAVRLWVEATPPLTVTVDDVPVTVAPQIEGGGVLVTVPVAPGDAAITVVDSDGRVGGLALGVLSEATPGRRQAAVRSGLNAVDTAIQTGDAERAHAGLTAISTHFPDDLDSAWQVQIRWGALSGYTGDHRAALSHYRLAIQQATRRGSAEDVVVARLAMASHLAAVGRQGEARRSTGPGDALRDCQAQESATWVQLEEQLFSRTARPSQLAEACAEIPRAALTRARYALQAGDIDAAEAALSEVPDDWHTGQLWVGYLTGRILHARGEHDAALAALDAVIAATRSASPRHRWQALVARGEILAGLGQNAQAIQALKEARSVLWEHSLLVPLHHGRDRFLSRGRQPEELLVSLLLAEGRHEAAFSVVRTARLQLVSGLMPDSFSADDRARWAAAVADYLEDRALPIGVRWSADGEQARVLQTLRRRQQERARLALDAGSPQSLPAPDLRDPEPGELLLTWYSMGETMVGIAASTAGVKTAVVDRVTPDSDLADLSEALLAPFIAQIDAAAQITLLPHGALREVDLHLLPLRGEPLLAHRPVRYSLDLPRREDAGEAPASALVITDPRLNLPGARAESDMVTSALAEAGRPVTVLSGNAAARVPVLMALEGVGLLHYAGHSAQERIVTDSAFLLAGGDRLTVADLLTVSRPPQTVVLSTCDGAASPRVAVESLGLAQALLLAGSQQVIAATRPVDDERSRALMARLYARPLDPVAVWREAVLQEDADAFRLMVP